jgi:hypothetical protein
MHGEAICLQRQNFTKSYYSPKSLRFTQTDCFVGNIFYKTELYYSPPRNDELQPPRNDGLHASSQ